MSTRLPDIVTPEQAADWLQVSRETVYRYIRDGRLVASQIGRAYRIRRENLDRFVDETSTKPPFEYRIYSDEEIAEFLELDKLDDDTLAIVKRFEENILASNGSN